MRSTTRPCGSSLRTGGWPATIAVNVPSASRRPQTPAKNERELPVSQRTRLSEAAIAAGVGSMPSCVRKAACVTAITRPAAIPWPERDVELDRRAGAIAVEHVVDTAFRIDDQRNLNHQEAELLAQVVFDITLQVEDSLLRLFGSEQRVVVAGKYFSELRVIADSGTGEVCFLAGLRVDWRLAAMFGSVVLKTLGQSVGLIIRNENTHRLGLLGRD